MNNIILSKLFNIIWEDDDKSFDELLDEFFEEDENDESLDEELLDETCEDDEDELLEYICEELLDEICEEDESLEFIGTHISIYSSGTGKPIRQVFSQYISIPINLDLQGTKERSILINKLQCWYKSQEII